MKFRLFFTILVIVSVHIQKGDSCTTVDDGCYSIYVCANSACSQCTNSSQCSSQHTIRTTCSSESAGDFCVQCSSDSQCGSGESCLTSSFTYLCASTCTSPTSNCGPSSQCIYIGGQFYCIPCENNIDCQGWSGNSASECITGVCSPAFLSCGQDSDCTNPASSYCWNSVCTACSSSSQCSHLTGTQICNLGTCVQCTSDSNCAAPTPYCSGSNTCVQCTSDSNCAGSTPHCNLGSNTCVQCTSDSNCAGSTPHCNLGSNTCVQCNGGSDCTAPTPHCSGNNSCVECITDSDCPLATAAQCSGSNTCVTCTLSTQCAHLTSTPVCKSSSGTSVCVECLSNSDCEDPSKSQCSPATNTCIDQTSNFSSGTQTTQLSVTLNNTAGFSQAALQIQSAGISLLPIIIRGGATTAVLLVNFVSDVLMYRFINVDFDDNFVEFCKKLYTNFLPNIYNTYEAEYNIPSSAIGKFSVFGMSSVIMGNSGNTLDREFVALSLIFTLTLLTSATKKFPKLQSIFRKFRDSYKWNLFLSFYLGDFGELFLFSMVQFRENPANCWYAWYGFSMCIIFVISYIILIGYIVYLLNRKAGAKIGDETKIEKPTSRWREVPESMNMICSDFKTDYWVQRNFMLMMLLESFINSMNYFFLQDHGTVQAFIFTFTTSVLLLLGAVVYRPYTSKLQNFIFGLNYSFKLILGIIAVFIGVRESTLSDDQLESAGLALIVVIVAAIASNVLIVVGVIISGLVQVCKTRFRKKTEKLPDETPAIIAAQNPPLNVISQENSSRDPSFNISPELKQIVVTPASLERPETPNISMLEHSSSSMRKNSSSTRLICPNPEANESLDHLQFSSFRIEAQNSAKTGEQIQSSDEAKTPKRQYHAASDSQFKISAKDHSQEPNDILFGTKIVKFEVDDFESE